MKKITSVLQLAKYEQGSIPWYLTVTMNGDVPEITEEHNWLKTSHPKDLYEKGPYKSLWRKKAQLPKLSSDNFLGIANLLLTEITPCEFEITDIYKSRKTGEFFYINNIGEEMPESYLFDTKQAALKEKNRVLTMIRKWATI